MRGKKRSTRSCLAASLLLASAGLFLSQCGDSSRDILVTPGFFVGQTASGGDLSVSVGSIDRIFFQCDGDEVVSPILNAPIDADLTFDVQFQVDSTTYRIQGRFGDDNTVLGTIDTGGGSSPCDGPFVALRCGGSQDCNDTDGDKIPDEVDPDLAPPPTITPTSTVTTTTKPGTTPTLTPSPTPTATPTEGGTTTTTTTSSTSTTTIPGATVTPTPTPTPLSCPTALTFEGIGGESDLDTGWTGVAHDSPVIGDGMLSFNIQNCPGSTRPNCGQCKIAGPIENPAGIGKANNHRCSGDTSVECTSDGECTGKGTCEFFFGAPLPLSAGAVSTCVTNQVNGEVDGTVNIEEGSGTAAIRLISRVFLGITVATPCPTCEGDSAPFDGSRDGTCRGGARDGSPCDVSGRHPFPSFGSTSFDCPPAGGALIATLDIDLRSTTGTVTKQVTDQSPNCTAVGWTSFKCITDTCAEPGTPACFTDADCTSGTCGGLRCVGGSNDGNPCTASSDCPSGSCGRHGTRTQVNQCDEGAEDCSVDDQTLDEGFCSSGPVDQLCTIETFRGCSSNADCPASGDTCGGEPRDCFTLDGTTSGVGAEIKAIGEPDPPEPLASGTISQPTIASIFAIAHTTSTSVNNAAGLPGLGRLRLKGIATLSGP